MTAQINQIVQNLRSQTIAKNKQIAIEALRTLAADTSFTGKTVDGTIVLSRYYIDEASATTKTIIGIFEKTKKSMTIYDPDVNAQGYNELLEKINTVSGTAQTNKENIGKLVTIVNASVDEQGKIKDSVTDVNARIDAITITGNNDVTVEHDTSKDSFTLNFNSLKTKATTTITTGTANHVNVSATTEADGHLAYTIQGDDIASASGLTAETQARKGVTGIQGDTYTPNTSTNYISGTSINSLQAADEALDAAIKVNADAINNITTSTSETTALTDSFLTGIKTKGGKITGQTSSVFADNLNGSIAPKGTVIKDAISDVKVTASGDTYVAASADTAGRKIDVKATAALTSKLAKIGTNTSDITAINSKLNGITDTVTAQTSSQISAALENYKVKTVSATTADGSTNITVTSNTDEKGACTITVKGNDIASAQDVSGLRADLGQSGATASANSAFGRIKGLEDKVDGLSSATHFRGVFSATTAVVTPQDGDIVVIVNNKEPKTDNGKEFIYSKIQSKWIELGDTTAEQAKLTELENKVTTGTVKNAEFTQKILSDTTNIGNDTKFVYVKDGVITASNKTLGTAAEANSNEFATSAQGKKADSALQAVTNTDKYLTISNNTDAQHRLIAVNVENNISQATGTSYTKLANAKAVKDYVDTQIGAVSITGEGTADAGKYISGISTNGKAITVTTGSLISDISTSGTSNIAPTTKAVKTYVDKKASAATTTITTGTANNIKVSANTESDGHVNYTISSDGLLTGITNGNGINVDASSLATSPTVSIKLNTTKQDNALSLDGNGLYLSNIWDCGTF